jgi:SAM-dependent methyltransferase
MAPGLRRGRFLRDHYSPAKPEVLSLIPKQANSILSFGCGETEIALAQRGKRIVSIPVDPVVSAAAAEKGVKLVIGDLESAIAQLQGQTFDCLLMLDVLHLIDDPVHVLSSLMKFLRSDGEVIALTPYIAGTQFLLSSLVWKEGKGSYRRAGVNITSPRIVRQWLRRAGAIPESVVTLSAGEGTAAGLVSKTLHLILSRQFMIRARRSAHSN